MVRRGGGGTTELADYGSMRRAWEDRHVTREIIGYYSGHLDAKGSAPHEARRLQRLLSLESVSRGGLENRLAQWRAALGCNPCNLGEQAVAERTARRFALGGGRDAIGSKTEEEANS